MSNLPSFKGLGGAFLDIKELSTADYTVTVEDANKTLLVADNLNGVKYTLPTPAEENVGLWFEFAFIGDSSAAENIIKVTSAGDNDILVAGTTANGVSPASTEEGNEWIRMLCITPQRYLQMGGLAAWVAVST